MDSSVLRDLLAGTERRLVEMDQTIERQREILTKREESGQDVSQEKALLTELERLRQLIRASRDRLLADVRQQR